MKRTFILHRMEDVSGVSGTGRIAEGIEFHDGQVAISWFGNHHCLSIWPSIKDAIEIHGHQGRTAVVWDTDELTIARRELAVLQGLLERERNKS